LPDHTGDTLSAFVNITHRRDVLAMFYPKHRSTRSIGVPGDVTCVVGANDNVDTEVKRARSHGT
jgi:hypothetical protein